MIPGEEKVLVATLATLGIGVVLVRVVANLGYQVFPTSALVCPGCVADLAAQLPGTDDDVFIQAAWDYVTSSIRYESFSSDITFQDGTIRCRDCELPPSTISSGMSNCVGSSGLLASILRNRLPQERVKVGVGNLYRNGVGGHAWVEVMRDDWYILEATAPPRGWVLASLATEYEPLVFFNDVEKTCLDRTLCVSIGRWGHHSL